MSGYGQDLSMAKVAEAGCLYSLLNTDVSLAVPTVSALQFA